MDLNDLERMQVIDTQDMIGHINGLPDQLAKAWELGQKLDLPAWEGIDRVLIAGMGGAAIGADLLVTYAAPLCSIPITVHRDYALPSWAKNENTLVICSSFSGNTEETLSAFEGAIVAGCRILAVAR
ncbi:MAG: bifunctional phosphoglucose/phosphomannose isomerase, partial [Anaerolineales bacterium]